MKDTYLKPHKRIPSIAIRIWPTLILLTFIALTTNAQNHKLYVGNSRIPLQGIAVDNTQAQKAAETLQQYLKLSTGVRIEIAAYRETPRATIHFETAEQGNKNNVTIDKEGFRITTSETGISFYAHSAAGFDNAVFYWLEHALGCRLYDHNALVIPALEGNKLPIINTVQNPAFEFRLSHNAPAYYENYVRWHGLNNTPVDTKKKGLFPSDQWGWWVHTLHLMVPPEKFFESHPEYFALRNGVRIKDQVCMTNPDALRIAIDNLGKAIEANPKAKYWSVSQMDNFGHCQCDQCRAIDSANGSAAGSLLHFVNQVAAAYPDKTITTLAYQYTRKAPSQIRPAENVNITLCSIESDRSRPIDGDSFSQDLKEWSALTNNILIWDYIINFSNTLGPFPNLKVLAPNLQLFEQNKVKMLFEQGWARDNAEMTELRSYLISKLLWNPYLDVDSLTRDFCLGFYGPGGEQVYEYIKLTEYELDASGKGLTLYEPMSAHKEGFLSPANLARYFALFDTALAANEGREPYHTRLRLATLPLRYAWIEVAKSMPFTPFWVFETDGTGGYRAKAQAREMLDELCTLATEHSPSLFHEVGLPPHEYLSINKTYFDLGYQRHKGVGAHIASQTPHSGQYDGGDANSLIDGVSGTDNYFALWKGWWGVDADVVVDLGSSQSIDSVATHCLVNQLGWIFEPEAIELSLSDDNRTFFPAGSKTIESAREQSAKRIALHTITLQQPTKARYVKMTFKSLGNMPEWRGVEGKAWMFVDEIAIY